MPEGTLSPGSLGASEETARGSVKVLRQRQQAVPHLKDNLDVMCDGSHNLRAPLNPAHTLVKGVGVICSQRA